MTSNKEVDLRTALGLLHEQLEDAMWKTMFDDFIEPIYHSEDYTHDEVRDAVGYVLEDKGYDEFDSRYGYYDPSGGEN